MSENFADRCERYELYNMKTEDLEDRVSSLKAENESAVKRIRDLTSAIKAIVHTGKHGTAEEFCLSIQEAEKLLETAVEQDA
jgi:hypothetical protein